MTVSQAHLQAIINDYLRVHLAAGWKMADVAAWAIRKRPLVSGSRLIKVLANELSQAQGGVRNRSTGRRVRESTQDETRIVDGNPVQFIFWETHTTPRPST